MASSKKALFTPESGARDDACSGFSGDDASSTVKAIRQYLRIYQQEYICFF